MSGYSDIKSLKGEIVLPTKSKTQKYKSLQDYHSELFYLETRAKKLLEKILKIKKDILKSSIPEIDYCGGRQEQWKNIKRDCYFPFDMLIPNIPSTEKVRNDLINLFENSNRQDYWKSLDEISRETVHSRDEIEKATDGHQKPKSLKDLFTPSIFVMNREGKYSTRQAYEKYSSWWTKFMDAFEFRIN